MPSRLHPSPANPYQQLSHCYGNLFSTDANPIARSLRFESAKTPTLRGILRVFVPTKNTLPSLCNHPIKLDRTLPVPPLTYIFFSTRTHVILHLHIYKSWKPTSATGIKTNKFGPMSTIKSARTTTWRSDTPELSWSSCESHHSVLSHETFLPGRSISGESASQKLTGYLLLQCLTNILFHCPARSKPRTPDLDFGQVQIEIVAIPLVTTQTEGLDAGRGVCFSNSFIPPKSSHKWLAVALN